jgi:hypothetical protein
LLSLKGKQAKAYPLSWTEQHRLVQLLPRHLADAVLYAVKRDRPAGDRGAASTVSSCLPIAAVRSANSTTVPGSAVGERSVEPYEPKSGKGQ